MNTVNVGPESGLNAIAAVAATIKLTPDRRLSRKDAAIYLGVSPKTLANLAYRGLGPRSVKICGRAFYFLDDLDAFIRQGGRA